MTAATEPPASSQHAHNGAVPECPYVGLVPFDEKDAAYFFGRKRESNVIVANLTASRLTLLYAPSGVGKSSVLRAGVLPQFHHINNDSYDLGIPGTAVAYVNTWPDAPLKRIAAEVVDAVRRVPGANAVEGVASAPQLTVPWLREMLRESGVSAIYLILDQFEEYFLYHPADHGEEGLTAELGRILSAQDLPVNVLLSIREDALASLDRFKGRVPHLFDNYFRLAHLTRNAAQAAIEGPVDRYNRLAAPERRMSIEPGLITTLLDQVRTDQVHVAQEGTAPGRFASDGSASRGDGGIETPYLQLVLTRLWERERATNSSWLQQSTLDDLGGAQKIWQAHLDNIIDSLPPAQVAVAADVFHHLVTPSGAKTALTAGDLADYSKRAVGEVQDLLTMLSSGPHSILRPLPPALGAVGPSRYEIFHDVLGPAVLDWRRRYMEQQQQFEASLRLKTEREEASRRLIAEREEASRRLTAEREEAQTAAAAAHQRLRRTQIYAVSMVVVLLVVCVLGYVAFRKSREAEQQRSLAQATAALADAAAALANNDPVGSLKHAVGAYHVSDNKEARDAVLKVASSRHSRLVAGPNPKVVGMKSTPDSGHVVAYDENGGIKVIGDSGVEREVKASGLRGTVTSAAVNPDASRVVLATKQGMVAVVDTAKEQRTVVIDIMEKRDSELTVEWVGSAANGLVLVVVADPGIAATYSPETRKQVAKFSGIRQALAMADGQHIVTSGEDKKLRVWDARTGAKTAESSELDSPPIFLRRYGQSVVGLLRGAFVVWNGQADPPVQHGIPPKDTYPPRQVSVDEKKQTINIAADKTVVTFGLHDGKFKEWLPQHADRVSDMDTSPDEKSIITAGADGRLLVWFPQFLRFDLPPDSLHPTYELLAHPGGVTQVHYLRNGKVVISLGHDGKVRWWKLPPVPRSHLHETSVVDIDVSLDGSLLATAGKDGRVHIIDPNDLSKEHIATMSTRDNAVLQAVRFDPNEPHRVLTLEGHATTPKMWRWGGSDGKIEQLRDYDDPQLPPADRLVSIAISPDGTMVAGGDTHGTIHLWDALTGKLRTDKFNVTGQPAYGVAFDPRGQLLAATDQKGILLWKLGTADPPALLCHPNAARVTFDPTGKHIASTGEGGGTIKTWTHDGKFWTRDCQPHRELVAQGVVATNPSFSKDGNLLAVGTAEGLVEIWDVRSGDTIMFDQHHGDPVRDVLFFPEDQPRRLISSSDDTTVAQFPCDACNDRDRVIQEARDWAKTN